MRSAIAPAILLLLCSPLSLASLNISNTASVKSSAQLIAENILSYYPLGSSSSFGQTIGTFGSSYSWGEAGAVWYGLVDYWALTGDSQFNDQVNAALVAQSGLPNALSVFLPDNQSTTESNADQALWALACMSAAENSFPGDVAGTPYITVADNVFNQQVQRWKSDMITCGGGLREVIQPFNQSLYSLKDSVDVGLFFQLAARLAVNTYNSTYASWAQTAWTWATSVGLVNTATWAVYKSVSAPTNCSSSSIDRTQLSAASATFLYGSSLMYNFTNSQSWVNAVQGLLMTLNATFFQQYGPNTLVESACVGGGCNDMEVMFAALTAQWVARTGNTAPFTTAAIQALLLDNAVNVASACSTQGVCSLDGQMGLSQSFAALNSIDFLLLGRAATLPGGAASSGTGAPTPSPTKSAASVVRRVCPAWLPIYVVICAIILA